MSPDPHRIARVFASDLIDQRHTTLRVQVLFLRRVLHDVGCVLEDCLEPIEPKHSVELAEQGDVLGEQREENETVEELFLVVFIYAINVFVQISNAVQYRSLSRRVENSSSNPSFVRISE